MTHKCAKNVVAGDYLKIGGAWFRITQVVTHFDEATISLWSPVRTRFSSEMILTLDKDQIIKVNTDKAEE
jgi:hypothetical protein